MSDKPNIVYIFSDQHRADVMGCAGNPVVQTPNLDRLAGEGIRFSRAYCQSPVCQPARASVLTGLYTQQHGVHTNNKEFDPTWPTVPQRLRQAGYTTALVGKTHFHHGRLRSALDGTVVDLREQEDFVRAFGYDYACEEFDRYVHAFDQVRTHYTEYLKANGVYAPYRDQIKSIFRLTPHHWDGVTSVLSQEHELTSFTAAKAMEWLRSNGNGGPFFLSLHFVAPHVPLMDDARWAARYHAAQIAFPLNTPPEIPNEVWGHKIREQQKHSNSHLLNEEYLLNAARHYYGVVSLVDQKIGEVVRLLEELNLMKNTWIVYSTDHGEMMGDHNLMAKSIFYKSAVRVPAIIRPPKPISGRVDEGIVEAIDLSATILAIANAEPLPGSLGISLLPRLDGKGSTKDAAFSSISTGNERYYYFSVHTGRYHYTVEKNTGTPCELFDLVDDPHEMKNLVGDAGYASVIREIHADLLAPHLALTEVGERRD